MNNPLTRQIPYSQVRQSFDALYRSFRVSESIGEEEYNYLANNLVAEETAALHPELVCDHAHATELIQDGDFDFHLRGLQADCAAWALNWKMSPKLFWDVIGVNTMDDDEMCIYRLLEWGFKVAASGLQAGDVVFYGNSRPVIYPFPNSDIFEVFRSPLSHVGIVIADGRVESKWGRGAVYRHDVNALPSLYGNRYLVFRKVQQKQPAVMRFLVQPWPPVVHHLCPAEVDDEHDDDKGE
jgi:hypothetical protein